METVTALLILFVVGPTVAAARLWQLAPGTEPGIVTWIASPLAVFLGAVLAAVVEAVKRAGFPNNAAPFLAVGLGTVGALLYVVFYGKGLGWTPEVGDILLRGFVLGLVSGGMFTFSKALGRVASGEETWGGTQRVERRRSNLKR